MTRWTRREFGAGTGATALTLVPHMTRAQPKARVVVVGGGIGGATVAKYLATHVKGLEITLVEPKTHYTTCFLSNLYLAGLRTLESLTHGYDVLAERYNIKIMHDMATAIDPVSKQVKLADGKSLAYDRLVVSPGIAFDYSGIDGYDETATESIPHAWNAGSQTRLLREQLEAMDDGGVFVIAAPPNPFRCPPGPYERASLAAYYFKQFKPRSKILILDAKDNFFEQDLFQEAWNRHYPNRIEWLPGQFTGGVKAVDVKTKSIRTASDTFNASVANIIPPQRAGTIAQTAGLADASGWCPIDAMTFESTIHPEIHIIGDAAKADDMPKSAFCANSQAKLCAFAIGAALTGSERAAPHLFNTCFTYLSGDDAISDAISFKPDSGKIKIGDLFMSRVDDRGETRKNTVREASAWYDAFTYDVFG